MKANRQCATRKHHLNLSLTEKPVEQAKGMNGTSSAAKAIRQTVALWNKFNSEKDSFADEYSTL